MAVVAVGFSNDDNEIAHIACSRKNLFHIINGFDVSTIHNILKDIASFLYNLSSGEVFFFQNLKPSLLKMIMYKLCKAD